MATLLSLLLILLTVTLYCVTAVVFLALAWIVAEMIDTFRETYL